MSLRTKLLLGLVPGLVIILALGMLNYLVLNIVAHRSEGLKQLFLQHDLSGDLQLAVYEAVIPPLDYLITGDPGEREEFVRLATEVEERFDAVRDLAGQQPEYSAAIEDAYREWRDVRALAEHMLALPPSRRQTEGAALIKQINEQAAILTQRLDTVHEQTRQRVLSMEAEAHDARNRLGMVVIVVTIAALAGGFLFGWFFSERLSRPMIALVGAAEAMAEGDLAKRLPVSGNDEIARVTQAFNRMADALQRREEEQRAVVEIIQSLNASQDVRTIFETVVNQLHRLVPFRRASIALARKGEVPSRFVMYTSAGEGEAALPTGQEWPLSSTAASSDILAGRIHRTDDLAAETEYPVERILYEAGFRSLICVPLIVEGEVIGALNLASTEPAAFANINVRPLQQVTATLAAVINQAWLREQLQASLQRRSAEADALNAIAAATVDTPDLNTVLDAALEQILSVVNLEAAGVHLPSPADPQVLELTAYRGVPPEFARAVSRLPVDTGFTGKAYRERRMVVLEDVSAHAPEQSLPVVAEVGWRAFAATPLLCGERVLGVLVVADREKKRISSEDRAFLQAAANQLGSAVEIALLRQKADRRLRELATLVDLTEKLNRTLSADEAIRAVVDVLRAQLGIPGAWYLSARDDPATPFRCTLTFNPPPALQVEGAMESTCRCQWMALQGQLKEAVNVLQCERLEGLPPEETGGISRHATVPVRSEGRLFGLLNLALPGERVLDADELHLVTAAGKTLAVALARARLHEQVKAQRVEEQKILLRLSQALLDKTEVQDVLDVAVHVAAEALGVEFAAITLIDEDGMHFSGRAGVGWPEEIFQQARHIPLTGDTGLAHAIRTRSPVVIPNMEEETRFGTPPWVRAAGIASSLLVPMIMGDRPVGGLVVNSRVPREWTQDEVRLLGLIANQTAQALERARLYTQVRQRAAELEGLYALSLELAEVTDWRDVCRLMTRAAAQALRVQRCLLAEFDVDAGEVRGLAPAYGLPDHVAESIRYEVTDEVLGVWDMSRSPYVIIPDVNYLFSPLRELAIRAGARALLAARMTVGDEPVGILFVANREDGDGFVEGDARLLAAYAQQAALALARARAHQAAQRRLDELEAYRRVTQAALGTFTLQERLDVILQEAMSLLEAEMGAVYLEKDGCLVIKAKSGIEGDTLGDLEEVMVSGEGFCQDVVRAWRTRSKENALHTIEALPLSVEGRETGVIVLASRREQAFAAEDIHTLRALSKQAAVVIEHARLHEELARAYREVQEALQLREDMIRNVSHELRTPLTSLRGYLELFLDGFLGELDAGQEKAIRVMYKNAERLRFMVERMLTLQTLGMKAPNMERIPTKEWLEDVVLRWRPRFAERGMSIVLEMPEDLSPVLGDKMLLDQVMDNLIHNALKFSPEGGTVWIEGRKAGADVVIAVRDQGVGIPKEKLERIFERFYQVDASPTRRFEGMGIGLALVKKIVEQHGGRVWAESEGEGKGSTFYITIPSAHTDQP